MLLQIGPEFQLFEKKKKKDLKTNVYEKGARILVLEGSDQNSNLYIEKSQNSNVWKDKIRIAKF